MEAAPRHRSRRPLFPGSLIAGLKPSYAFSASLPRPRLERREQSPASQRSISEFGSRPRKSLSRSIAGAMFPFFKNRAPVLKADFRVCQSCALEASKHVLSIDIGPEIPVIASVVSAHEMPERCRKLSVWNRIESLNVLVEAVKHGRRIHRALRRMVAHIQKREHELASIEIAFVETPGRDHLS